jgi:hypothetical protein
MNLNLIRKEPVLFQGLLQAGLGVAVAFGLHLSPLQIGAVLGLAAAILSFITRQLVTPTITVAATVAAATAMAKKG